MYQRRPKPQGYSLGYEAKHLNKKEADVSRGLLARIISRVFMGYITTYHNPLHRPMATCMKTSRTISQFRATKLSHLNKNPTIHLNMGNAMEVRP